MHREELKAIFKAECTHELSVQGLHSETVLSIDPIKAFDWILNKLEKSIIRVRLNHPITNKSAVARLMGIPTYQLNGKLKNHAKPCFTDEETEKLIEIFEDYFDYTFDRGDNGTF